MKKSFGFAFVLVVVLAAVVPGTGHAACRSSAMSLSTVSAVSSPLVLPPLQSRAKPGPVSSPSVESSCCDEAAAECEWRCTQGIKTFWCDPNGCGPGCCAVQCDCWIWE